MYIFGYTIQHKYTGKFLTPGWRWSNKIPTEFHTKAGARQALKEFLTFRPKAEARVVRLYSPYVLTNPED